MTHLLVNYGPFSAIIGAENALYREKGPLSIEYNRVTVGLPQSVQSRIKCSS